MAPETRALRPLGRQHARTSLGLLPCSRRLPPNPRVDASAKPRRMALLQPPGSFQTGLHRDGDATPAREGITCDIEPRAFTPAHPGMVERGDRTREAPPLFIYAAHCL